VCKNIAKIKKVYMKNFAHKLLTFSANFSLGPTASAVPDQFDNHVEEDALPGRLELVAETKT
jgi:hypothetical protein